MSIVSSSRAGVFWSDGYRPFFLVFPVWGATFLALWARALAGGPPIPVADHAAVLVWGFLGGGVIGFLLTAFPRQNGAALPSARGVRLASAGHLSSQAALAATWAGLPLGVLGTVAGTLVWAGMTAWTATIAARSLRTRWEWTTLTVPFTLAAATVGWVANRAGAPWAAELALHGFLLPLALALLDRMIPFFSQRVVPGWSGGRPGGFVLLLAGGLVLRAVAGRAGDVAIVAVLARQWLAWQPWRGVRVPLVGVLHLGVAWALVGYFAEAAGAPRGACVHLWTVGSLTTLILGFGARVALGHGGQPLRLDGVGTAAVVLVQVALLVRLAVFAGLPAMAGVPTLPVAGVLLAAALLLWAWRYAPLLFRR